MSTTAVNTTITGTLSGSAPGTSLRMEVFLNPTCDPSGAGEGQVLLGAKAVTTNGAGNATWSLVVSPLGAGQAVTATATRNSAPRNTSEFSVCAAT